MGVCTLTTLEAVGFARWLYQRQAALGVPYGACWGRSGDGTHPGPNMQEMPRYVRGAVLLLPKALSQALRCSTDC